MNRRLALWALFVCAATSWAQEPPYDPKFDHTQTRFPLDGKHVKVTCAQCHDHLPKGAFFPGPDACEACHDSPHLGQFQPPNQPDDGCLHCHTTTRWKPSTFSNKRHAENDYVVAGAHKRIACASCHKQGQYTGTPRDCQACHVDPHVAQHNDHGAQKDEYAGDCRRCHDQRSWDPFNFDHQAKTGVALVGAHQAVHCTQCHGADGQKLKAVKTITCATCHQSEMVSPAVAARPLSHGMQFGADCGSCHQVTKWSDVKPFNHAQTHFPLERRHAALRCNECHNQTRAGDFASGQCRACHDDPHRGRTTMDCGDCHRADSWLVIRFDHDRTEYPLNGAHFAARCRDCHINDVWIGTPRECIFCHRDDLGRVNATSAKHRQDSLDCAECHNAFRW